MRKSHARAVKHGRPFKKLIVFPFRVMVRTSEHGVVFFMVNPFFGKISIGRLNTRRACDSLSDSAM
jgi:hypothetical protein